MVIICLHLVITNKLGVSLARTFHNARLGRLDLDCRRLEWDFMSVNPRRRKINASGKN